LTNKTTGHIIAAMSKRETKKDHILWAGLELMRANGYNGTSVKDIVDAAGVPKGSFYNYFDSKQTFAVEALDAYGSRDYEACRSLLSVGDKTPMQRIAHYFEQSVNRSCDCGFKIGCFFGNMCQEMADCNEPIRVKVRQLMAQHTQLIAAVLEEAKQAGEISSDVQTTALAEFILNAWEGSLIRMKAVKNREPLDQFMAMLPQIVQ